MSMYVGKGKEMLAQVITWTQLLQPTERKHEDEVKLPGLLLRVY
jgi:hypothetical protein